jgi:hypothetical protein
VDCDRRTQKEGDLCINCNVERIGSEDEPILNFSMTSHPQYRLPNSHGRGLISGCWCFSPGVADATDAQPAMKRRNEESRGIVKVVERKK